MIDSLEDDCLERIASFLPKTSRAFFAVALTAPVERWCKVWGNPSTSAAKVLSVTPAICYERVYLDLTKENVRYDLRYMPDKFNPPEWEITLQKKRLKRYYNNSNESQWEHFDTADLDRVLAGKLDDDDIEATLWCIGAGECTTHVHLTNCINLYGSCLEPLRGSNVLELVDFNTSRMRSNPKLWRSNYMFVGLTTILEILLWRDEGQNESRVPDKKTKRSRVLMRTLMFPWHHTNANYSRFYREPDPWYLVANMKEQRSKAIVNVSAQTIYLDYTNPSRKKLFNLRASVYECFHLQHWCHLCGGVEKKTCHDCGFIFCKNDECIFDSRRERHCRSAFNCQSDRCSAFSCNNCFVRAKPDPCWVIPCETNTRKHSYCFDCRRRTISIWKDCNACQDVYICQLAAGNVKQARIIDKLEEDNAHLKDEVEELKRMQSRLLTKDDKQNETIHKLEGKLSELTGKVEMHFTAQKQLESTVNNLGERFEQMEFQHRSNDEPESAVEIEGSSLKRAKR